MDAFSTHIPNRKRMKVLFHLGHPAHFHLFKNTISILKEEGFETIIAIKKKDVLEDLLKNAGFSYINLLPSGRKDGFFGLFAGLFKQDIRLFNICKEHKPDLLVGTSVSISHVGLLLRIPSLNFNEDDANAVPYYSILAYPTATKIVSPQSCNNLIWNRKTLFYKGYHELAYLHPDYFEPNRSIVNKYFNSSKPYFLLRFAQLKAHHDHGAKGITSSLAKKMISILEPHGNIFITSERVLEPEFEKYQLNIDPIDMHHFIAFANIYIGDSQTMSAEAAVLGTPSIRFNDFVGRLGYLEELEKKYKLTYGFKSNEVDKLLKKINEILSNKDSSRSWEINRTAMLKDNEDVSSLFVELIKSYQIDNKESFKH